MKKKSLTTILAGILAMSMSMTAFAGWQQNENGKWWQNDDGSQPANSWQWLDGNKDGVAECYYFNGDGYMLANTTTPDGYAVNADGAWVENGTVQTKRLDPHLSEVINPQQGLNGGEVTDGKSVAQITVNQELVNLIRVANSADSFPNKAYVRQNEYGNYEYTSDYRGRILNMTVLAQNNTISGYIGTADQVLNNIPANGIEVMAFYANAGFENADANRWVVGPTGWDVFGLGDAYMGSRFTTIFTAAGHDFRITIVLTQGSDGNWYIYPNSQAQLN